MATKQAAAPEQEVVILSESQIEEARFLREDADKTYAEIAKGFGVPAQDVKDALAGKGRYAPVAAEPETALDKLLAEAEEHGILDLESEDPDVVAARNDRALTEDEITKLETIYRTGRYSFETMGAALDPPVNGFTVQDALGSRGWYRPNFKTITYSTATEEGAKRYAQELNRASGIVPVLPVEIDGDPAAEAAARTAAREAQVRTRIADREAATA